MNLQITNAGVAALNSNGGPLVLNLFELGSGYNYTPEPTDTNIHGTEVWSGVPTTPIAVSANVYKYSIILDAEVGPLSFGEVGLYFENISTEGLFALGSMSSLLNKVVGQSLRIDIYLSMVGTNYSMWLDVASSTSPFQMASLQSIDYLPPSAAAEPNVYIVDGATTNQSAFMAYTDRTGLWYFDQYQYGSLMEATIVSATSQSVTINLANYSVDMTPTYFGQVMLQFITGTNYSICRNVLNTITTGSYVVINFNTPMAIIPVAGDVFNIYNRQAVSTSNIILPIASSVVLGGIKVGSTLSVASDGTLNANFPVLSVNGITGAVELTASEIPGLSTVATTGSYTDLLNRPTPYALPIATGSTLGGVKSGGSGNISINSTSGVVDLSFYPVKTVNGYTPNPSTGDVEIPTGAGITGLINPQGVGSTIDLNTVTTVGLYYTSSGNSLVNAPEVSTVAALEVTTTNGGTTGIMQRWTSTTGLYYRSLLGGSWSAWSKVALTTQVFANPMTAVGDIIYGTTGGAATNLAIGSSGQVLTVMGGIPIWQTPTVYMTNPMINLGDLIVGGASGTPTNLVVGTNGYVLTVVSGTPQWAAPTGGGGGGGGVVIITGGSIDNTIIGGTTPAAGTFTTLNATTVQATTFQGSLYGGSAGTLVYQSATSTTAFLSPSTDGSLLSLSSGQPVWVAATTVFNPAVVAITGGAINGTTIGGTTPAAGSFTTINATTIGATSVNATTFTGSLTGTASKASNLSGGLAGSIPYQIAAGTTSMLSVGSSGQILTVVSGLPAWVSSGSFYNPAAVSITGGTIDGTVIGGTTPAAGSFTTVSATTFTGALTGTATTANNIAAGAAGSVPYQTAAGATSFIAIGSTGQILTVVGGLPTWAANAAMLNPMTTAGDIIVGGSSGAATRLAIGSTGQVLTVVAGVPSWSSSPTLTGTNFSAIPYSALTGAVPTWNQSTTGTASLANNIAGGTAGAIVYQGATNNTSFLAAGTNGYVLTMVSGVPAWAASSGGGYNPAAVAITGGTINGTSIGQTTAAAGTFTSLTATNNNISVGGYTIGAGLTGTAQSFAIGTANLTLNTGLGNIAIGFNSMPSVTTGQYNVSLGVYTLTSLVSGSYNSAIGDLALTVATGSYNTGTGYYALGANTSGQYNVAIGYQAGYTGTSANGNVSGNNNTWVGANAGPSSTTQYSNSTALGYGALTSASNQVVLGNSSVTTVTTAGAISTTNTTAATSSTVGAIVATGGIAATSAFFTIGTFGSTANGLILENLVGGTGGAVYSTGVTPAATNYSLAATATTTSINAATSIGLLIAGTSVGSITATGLNGTAIGATTPSTGAFTTVSATTFTGALSGNATTSTTANNIAAGASGSLLYQTAASATGFIAAGTNTYVLTMVGGTPTWSAPPAGFSNPMTTAGDMIVGGTSGGALRLGIGSTNQVLTVVGGTPTWAAASTIAAAGTLTGTTLASNVVTSSLTSVGTLTALTVSSNVATTGITMTNAGITTVTYTSSATTAGQVIDSVTTASIRTVKYLIQAVSGTTYQACEILINHDGTTPTVTEYGDINIGTVASFDATITSGNLNLVFTPVNAVTTVRVVRTAINI